MTAWYLIIGFFMVYLLAAVLGWTAGLTAAGLLAGAVVLYVLWKRQQAMTSELDALRRQQQAMRSELDALLKQKSENE